MPFNTQQSLILSVPRTWFVVDSSACSSVHSTTIHCSQSHILAILPLFCYEPILSTTSIGVEPSWPNTLQRPHPLISQQRIAVSWYFGGEKILKHSNILGKITQTNLNLYLLFLIPLMLHSFQKQKPATLEHIKIYATS